MKKKKLLRRLARAELALEEEVRRNRQRDAARDEEWMGFATRLNSGTRPPKPMFGTDYLPTPFHFTPSVLLDDEALSLPRGDRWFDWRGDRYWIVRTDELGERA